jgi:apolipoprotein D and lipocalin family protein
LNVHPESNARAPSNLTALLLLAAAWAVPGQAKPPLDLVDEVDLQRYQGLWYQIALLPNRFQARCAADTTAEYTPLENGHIRVVNRCRTAGGEFDRAEGIARPADPDRPAALEVRFAPRWLSFLPFVWGKYQIMSLDEDYEWAMVGAPSRKYLWILAREPTLPEARIDALLSEAARQGFAISDVQRSKQSRP